MRRSGEEKGQPHSGRGMETEAHCLLSLKIGEKTFVRMIYLYISISLSLYIYDLNVLRGRNSLLTSYQPHPLNNVLSFSLKLSSAWFLAMTDQHYEVFS